MYVCIVTYINTMDLEVDCSDLWFDLVSSSSAIVQGVSPDLIR